MMKAKTIPYSHNIKINRPFFVQYQVRPFEIIHIPFQIRGWDGGTTIPGLSHTGFVSATDRVVLP